MATINVSTPTPVAVGALSGGGVITFGNAVVGPEFGGAGVLGAITASGGIFGLYEPAGDALFAEVEVLLQGGTTTPQVQDWPVTITGSVTPALDHLALGADGKIATVQPGGGFVFDGYDLYPDNPNAYVWVTEGYCTYEAIVEIDPLWPVGARLVTGNQWHIEVQSAGVLEVHTGGLARGVVTAPLTGRLRLAITVTKLVYSGIITGPWYAVQVWASSDSGSAQTFGIGTGYSGIDFDDGKFEVGDGVLNAATKAYGIRVTSTDRESKSGFSGGAYLETFPYVPLWALSTLQPSVFPDNVWLAVDFEGGQIKDLSAYQHALFEPPTAGLTIAMGSRTGDAYIESGASTTEKLTFYADVAEIVAGDITLEFDILFSVAPSAASYMGFGGTRYLGLDPAGAGQVAISDNMFSGGVLGGAFAVGSWHHIALVSRPNVPSVRLFIDGAVVDVASISHSSAGFDGSLLGLMNCGGQAGLAGLSNARIDNFIITKAAKYTNNFTPASAGLQQILDALLSASAVLDTFLGSEANFTVLQSAEFAGIRSLDSFATAGAAFSVTEMAHFAGASGLASVAAGTTGFTATLPELFSGAASIGTIAGAGVFSEVQPLGFASPLLGVSIADVVSSGTLTAGAPELGQVAAVLPKFTAKVLGGARMQGVLATGFTSSAFGVVSAGNRMAGELQPIAVTAFGGAKSSGQLPALGGTASGLVEAVGLVDAQLPAYFIVASGRVSRTGQVDALLPFRWTGSGLGGAQAMAQLPALSVSAFALAGSIGGVTGALPEWTLEASGSPLSTGRVINAALPMLVSAPGVRAMVSMPSWSMVALGGPVIGATFMAYAVNLGSTAVDPVRSGDGLSIHQVTRYTNFPFYQIARYQDTYLAVGPGGTYQLGGADDAGTPVAWSLDLCTTDFGKAQKKNVSSAYVGGQLGALTDFTIQCGERPDQMHSYKTTAITAQRNHRQKFGLGRVTRYYSLGLSGNGPMAIDSIELELAVMNRRI